MKALKSEIDPQEIQALVQAQISKSFIPSSVYRLQFNSSFTFKDATAIVPYLKELGISAIYCSPYFQATPGSMHGYDVTDPNRLNTELGSEADYEKLCQVLKEHGIKQILDVVSNHMGIAGTHNPWWVDVLENGPSSIYAHFFDIDWEPEKRELHNKVLIPILGDLYGRVLENREFTLKFCEGIFTIEQGACCLPVRPDSIPMILLHGAQELEQFCTKKSELNEFRKIVNALGELPSPGVRDWEIRRQRHHDKELIKRRLTRLARRSPQLCKYIEARVKIFNGVKGAPGSFNLLDELLSQQSYRVAHWRVASEEINYRRFFDVNDLAAIRIEDESVYKRYHRLLFNLLREDKVHGIRIDHPDGLYNPPEYFQRLQKTVLSERLLKTLKEKYAGSLADAQKLSKLKQNLKRILNRKAMADVKLLYIVAEKILDHKETLPSNWEVHGTVGYDALNALTGIFVDQRHERVFDEFYKEFTGFNLDFNDLTYQKKKFFALVQMASEINTLGHHLNRISETDRHHRDITLNHLTLAIREVIACFPVYRTYIGPTDRVVSARDEKYIHIAVEKAKHKTPALNPIVYDFLKSVLLLGLDPKQAGLEERPYRDFVLRFQQLTGPIMAKGFEDTVFYEHNRFICLNEVGGDPVRFGWSRQDFHRQNTERHKAWPASFLTSSTHDTKRSEDVRMRLAVLSEDPEEWKTNVMRWARANEKHKTLIDEVAQPDRNTEYFIYQTLVGVWPDKDQDHALFFDRMWQYHLKAVREAKRYTNWFTPNAEYEKAVHDFLKKILAPGEDNQFLKNFLLYQQKIAYWGHLNSLSALVLKFGSPGVTDTYQGNELWTYQLVDPDNRMPVDFKKRIAALAKLKNHLERSSPDSFIKDMHASCQEGVLKLYLLWQANTFRSAHADLFLGGEYHPLKTEGLREKHAIAFMRRKGEDEVIVIAGRILSSIGSVQCPLGPAWEDTCVVLPRDFRASKVKNVFTSQEVAVQWTKEGPTLNLTDCFQSLACGFFVPA